MLDRSHGLLYNLVLVYYHTLYKKSFIGGIPDEIQYCGDSGRRDRT